ncbi:hypothetical protein DVH24_042394 [Malus domestica]|uniref:Uncharacterized protein n=1 Tax=Malus domestica TaxID=3750 RepID=A0A498J395_MALDO|nr:hypothetical protein DVH24_042394 [Malus domestica]
MDQIWEILTKISTFTNAHAECHSNFKDMEKQMKNLQNSRGTTPSTHIPVFGFGSRKATP